MKLDGNVSSAHKYMTPIKRTVDIINCNFRVLYTLSRLFTVIQWVDNALTKIQSKIPNAININGYIKFEM